MLKLASSLSLSITLTACQSLILLPVRTETRTQMALSVQPSEAPALIQNTNSPLNCVIQVNITGKVSGNVTIKNECTPMVPPEKVPFGNPFNKKLAIEAYQLLLKPDCKASQEKYTQLLATVTDPFQTAYVTNQLDYARQCVAGKVKIESHGSGDNITIRTNPLAELFQQPLRFQNTAGEARAKEAMQAFQKQDYAKAEQLYQEASKLEPATNTTVQAFLNAQMQQARFSQLLTGGSAGQAAGGTTSSSSSTASQPLNSTNPVNAASPMPIPLTSPTVGVSSTPTVQPSSGSTIPTVSPSVSPTPTPNTSTTPSPTAAPTPAPSVTATPTPASPTPTPSPTATATPSTGSPMVSTLAGSGDYAFLDDTGTAAKFKSPSGVAVDSSGNVFVADRENYRIRKITSAGVVTTFAGSGQSGYSDGIGTIAQFSSPVDIAIDFAGNLYVSDSGRIRKISSTGIVSTFAGDGNPQQLNPAQITVDINSNVYVSETANNRIRKVTPAGVISTFAGSDESGFSDGVSSAARFSHPRGVAADINGNVYVVDAWNQSIRKISPTGDVSTLTSFYGLSGNCINNNNSLPPRLCDPWGIAVDSSANVYVGDYNAFIAKITPNGVVSNLVGYMGKPSFADGIGSAALFSTELTGLAVDLIGNIYVADRGNRRIRKITP